MEAKWKKIAAKRVWHLVRADREIVGWVRCAFNVWDAYVPTGNSFAKGHERCVGSSSDFYEARRKVLTALGEQAG